MTKVGFPDVPDEDWAAGGRQDAPGRVRRWIGLYEARRGPAVFVVSVPELVPKDAICVEETDDAPGANERARGILREFLSSRPGSPSPKLEPGSVVTHSDGQAVHSGVVLAVDGDWVRMLFSTSSPLWNSKSRPMTTDEQAMMGFASKGSSYFAPVVRAAEDLSPLGRFFPEHRVAALLEEFDFEE
jgi:hypothetical protein